jgi:hypothetical protein
LIVTGLDGDRENLNVIGSVDVIESLTVAGDPEALAIDP